MYSVYLLEQKNNIAVERLPLVLCTTETNDCIDTLSILKFISLSTSTLSSESILKSKMAKLVLSQVTDKEQDFLKFIESALQSSELNIFYNDTFNSLLAIYYPSGYSSSDIILGVQTDNEEENEKLTFSKSVYVSFLNTLFTK
jgi:hypothetical protein